MSLPFSLKSKSKTTASESFLKILKKLFFKKSFLSRRPQTVKLSPVLRNGGAPPTFRKE